ncbi:hypothetical protein X975_18352, partial [Stegodyphus mimosarum]
MVLSLKKNFPAVERIKVSHVVLVSGMLTFLYLLEICLGFRTVYYAFNLWNNPKHGFVVSWTLCVACLLLSVGSSFAVSVLSAMWEQKQLEEEEKPKSVIRFALHIIVGGMIWRYICLWFSNKKEHQKKGALLLAINKFLFTQLFTIPNVIVHLSLMDSLENLLFDVCSILCISINLILVCTIFSSCRTEVDDLKKWNYETIDLVPLVFSRNDSSDKVTKKTDIQDKSVESNQENNGKAKAKRNFEIAAMRIIILFQTFGFSLGRLLALGILLKMAGVYAVSIMLLQLLLSVIYLKFQAPVLVSECLPKWRQLLRLAFLSYILIFEWHLNRDPKTGYDFTSNMKHGIFYYCVATVESVFYLITWAVTSCCATGDYILDTADPRRKFTRNIIIIGTLSLVFSLTIHIFLLFWHSRRMRVLFRSVRRRYVSTKLRMSTYGSEKKAKDENGKTSKHCKEDISGPIPVGKETHDDFSKQVLESPSEKHNSYVDLREPLDEEIEICSRETKSPKKEDNIVREQMAKNSDKNDIIQNADNYETSGKKKGKNSEVVREADIQLPSIKSEAQEKGIAITTVTSIEHEKRSNILSNTSPGNVKEAVQQNAVVSMKSRVADSITQQWNKLSSVSRKFTGNMREHIQKRKEHFLKFRSVSNTVSCNQEYNPKYSPSNNNSEINHEYDLTKNNPREQSVSDLIESSEDHFLGDDAHTQENKQQFTEVSKFESVDLKVPDNIDSEADISANDSTKMSDGTLNSSESAHCDGDSSCPCYICRTSGGTFLRRRSSSVPPPDRKLLQDKVTASTGNKALSRFLSNPNMLSHVCDEVNLKDEKLDDEGNNNSFFFPKGGFRNLSLLSLENRVEHYV